MFEKAKEKNQIKKDLNRRYEILDDISREITNKSIELKSLEENISNLQEKLARLQSKLGFYESLEAIEKQRMELETMVKEIGGYTKLKDQVDKLKSEKDYLETKKYDVKDIIFARYKIIGNDEIHFSSFVSNSIDNDYVDGKYMKLIVFKELGGIHKLIYAPYLGKGCRGGDSTADVHLIDFLSYGEICSALGIELKGYLTYEEAMNISNTFRSYMAQDCSLTDTLNEIRNGRVNNTNMHR